MFIERLTDSDLDVFAKTLTSFFDEFSPADWSVTVQDTCPNVKTVYLVLDGKPQYNAIIELHDSMLAIRCSGMFDKDYLQCEYLLLMYKNFGKEHYDYLIAHGLPTLPYKD